MYNLAAEAAIEKVQENVDLSRDYRLETPLVFIGEDVPEIANVAVVCTLDQRPAVNRQIFWLVFSNRASPRFATSTGDLNCLLVNAHGVVLEREDEYWKQFSQDVLRHAGAIDTDGPPMSAAVLLDASWPAAAP